MQPPNDSDVSLLELIMSWVINLWMYGVFSDIHFISTEVWLKGIFLLRGPCTYDDRKISWIFTPSFLLSGFICFSIPPPLMSYFPHWPLCGHYMQMAPARSLMNSSCGHRSVRQALTQIGHYEVWPDWFPILWYLHAKLKTLTYILLYLQETGDMYWSFSPQLCFTKKFWTGRTFTWQFTSFSACNA